MEETLVQIATFTLPHEAYLCKTRLEAEGIECFLANDTDPYAGVFLITMGGVRLKVKASDAERALSILEEGPIEAESIKDAEVEYGVAQRCPNCGSPNLKSADLPLRLFFLGLLSFGWPFPYIKRDWKCKDCGYQWKKSD